MQDVPALSELINAFADKNYLLARSCSELYETIRDFTVLSDASGAIHGCCALHIINARIAEVKSLAVSDQVQGGGWGKKLVLACAEEAAQIGLSEFFASPIRWTFLNAVALPLSTAPICLKKFGANVCAVINS